MSDLIEKKDVVELLNNSYVHEDGIHNWRDHNNDCIDRLIEKVKAIPSVRPTGKWIWNENGMDWGLGCWCCSECDMRNPYIGSGDNALLSNPHNWAGSKYCPNCGADMRGE